MDEGDIPEELSEAFAAMIRGSQAVVDSFLRDFSPAPPLVEVRLVEKWTLDAYATRKGDGYSIGIHVGIVPELLRPFTDGLSNGCIAPVRDRDRLALWLLNAAIEFLIFHELGHIMLGHLEYCEQVSRYELATEDVAEESELDVQAIEMMADEFAVMAVRATRFSGRYVDESGIPEFSDPAVYDHAYLFAVGLLFMVMTPPESFALVRTTSHPHPEFRMMVAWALLYLDRPAPERLGEQVVADLAQMPKVLGIPNEAFVGTHWSIASGKQVQPEAVGRMVEIFGQLTRAVNRMRPRLDWYRKGFLGEDR